MTKKEANKKAINKAVQYSKKLADNNKFRYKNYGETDHACPICHKKTKVKGFNCIGFPTACFAHGAGDPKMLRNCRKNNGAGLGNNYTLNHNIKANWLNHNGKNWKYITNHGKLGGKSIAQSRLKAGDILLGYDKYGNYKHTMMYIGNGKIRDARSSGTKAKQISVHTYKSACQILHITRAFRYTGRGRY